MLINQANALAGGYFGKALFASLAKKSMYSDLINLPLSFFSLQFLAALIKHSSTCEEFKISFSFIMFSATVL